MVSSWYTTTSPCRRASRGLEDWSRSPKTRTVPSSAASRPLIMPSRVDLPAPFSPTSAWMVPGSTTRSAPWTAYLPANFLDAPTHSMAGTAAAVTAAPGCAGGRRGGGGAARGGGPPGRPAGEGTAGGWAGVRAVAGAGGPAGGTGGSVLGGVGGDVLGRDEGGAVRQFVALGEVDELGDVVALDQADDRLQRLAGLLARQHDDRAGQRP